MYKCSCCGSSFPVEKAAKKPNWIKVHGEWETDDEDVCPYCKSEDIEELEDPE